jgi:hypothetical protein
MLNLQGLWGFLQLIILGELGGSMALFILSALELFCIF